MGRSTEARPFFVAAGRFEPKKGFFFLLQACAKLRQKLPNFRCAIIGAGREADSLRREAKRLLLDDFVELRPWCTPDELALEMRAATAFVVPSVIGANGDQDNIPNVMLEALAQSTPVVSSALPAIAEVLAQGGAGILVPPGDSDALAAALERIATDEALADQLRQRGRLLVRREFDLKSNARRLLAKLELSACQRKAAPAHDRGAASIG
jgi:glycosyltransferase involved in cell wall biosynthesis